MQARRGVWLLRFVPSCHFAHRVMAECLQSLVSLLPDVTAAGHPQWVEDRLFHKVVEFLSGDMFDNFREVDETFTRLAESIAWRELNLERSASRPPVREAGRVAQDVTRGDLPQARVVAYIVIPRQILVEWLVQVEFASVKELQHGVCEDRLAQARGFKDCIVGDWLIRLCILHAE